MKFIKRIIGLIILIFGILLLNITIKDAIIKSIILKMVGGIVMIIGIIILNKKKQKIRDL